MTVWIYVDTKSRLALEDEGGTLPKTFRVGGAPHYMSPVQEIMQPGPFVDRCAAVLAGKSIVTLLSPRCLGSLIYRWAFWAGKIDYHRGVVAHP